LSDASTCHRTRPSATTVLRLELEQLRVVRRERGVVLLRLQLLELVPAAGFHLSACIFAAGGPVVLLAVERGLVEFDAHHPGGPGADEHPPAGDHRAPLDVNRRVLRLAEDELPQRAGGAEVEAVEHARAVEVGALAEHQRPAPRPPAS
jgi:hypothetical protein